MSDNKVDNKLDFRNVTVSQFDPGQTQKMAFSEYQSAYKHFETNAILKQPYSHFIQTLDGQNRPTRVEYYQATHPVRDRINVRADNGGDLAGKYILLQEYISKKTFVYYFVVSGSGSAPGIGDVEIPVEINTNDPTSLVAFALKSELKATEEFEVIGSQVLSGYVDIEYLEFGETAAIDTGTTGFLTTRINAGQSYLVGEVDLEYNSNGDPIYNGNLLKGLLFNPYTASFDPELSEIDVTVTADLDRATNFTVINENIPLKDTEVTVVIPDGVKRFKLQSRQDNSKLTVRDISSGDYFTIRFGAVYEERDLKTSGVTLIITASKDNTDIELLTWS